MFIRKKTYKDLQDKLQKEQQNNISLKIENHNLNKDYLLLSEKTEYVCNLNMVTAKYIIELVSRIHQLEDRIAFLEANLDGSEEIPL